MGQLQSLSAILSSAADSSDLSKSGSSEKIPKSLANFWWDRIIFLLIVLNITIVTIETALGIVDSDHQVRCYIQEEHTSEQAEYINSLCLSDAPEFSKYVRLVTFSQVAILSALQYFWHLVSGSGKTENFLISLTQMKFVREPETGKFCAQDLDIARRLQYRFGRRQRRSQSSFCGCNARQSVYCSYVVLKLILQLLICVGFIVVYSVIIRSKMRQRHTFVCQNSNNDTVMPSSDENIPGVVAEWPLSVFAVSCTFVPLVSLTQLQYFNIAILLLICICLFIGFFMVTIVPFGSKTILFVDIAKFVAYTGLRADHFHKNSFLCCNRGCCQVFCTGTRLIFVKSDLQFLLLRLFATDYRAGSILRDILIEKEVNRIREDTCCCKGEHEKLNKERHTNEHLAIKNNVSACVKSIWNQANDDNGDSPYCILVTHETDLFAYILDHHQFKKMMCVNFNPYVLPTDETQPCAKAFDLHSGAPSFLQIPSHQWSWRSTKEQHKKLKSAVRRSLSKMISIESNSSCDGQCSGAQERISSSDQQSFTSPAGSAMNSNSLADDDNVFMNHMVDCSEPETEREALLVPENSTGGGIDDNSKRRSVTFNEETRITSDHGPYHYDNDDDDRELTNFARRRSRTSSLTTDSAYEFSFSQQSSTTSTLAESDLLIIFTPLSDKEFGALHIDHRGGRRVQEDEFRGKPYSDSSSTSTEGIPSCLYRLHSQSSTGTGTWKCASDKIEEKRKVEGVFGGVHCKFDVNLYEYTSNE